MLKGLPAVLVLWWLVRRAVRTEPPVAAPNA
jgi:hypothetical protein